LYENIFIEENGFNLHGWLYESEESDKILVYFHGNAGNIGNRLARLKQLERMGYSIFIYDYPGYGLSKGYATEKSLYDSAKVVIEYILSFKDKKNLILYGESIGCAVATHVADAYDIQTLILQSGFLSMKEMGKDILHPNLHGLLLFVNEFDTASIMARYNGRCLVMHSKDDEIIPYRHADELRNKVERIYDIHGSHNDPIFDTKQLVEFIDKK